MIIAGLSLITYSCSKDAEAPQQEALTQTELKTILEADDSSGIVDGILADIYMNDSNNSAKSTNDCHEASYTDTGFTVVFNNCLLNGTDNVNGTLVVTYAVEENSAAFTATYDGFYVNDIELNGTRAYELSGNSDESSISFSVTSNMSVTLADGQIISENGTKTLGFMFGDTPTTSIYTIAGIWTIEAEGNTYSVAVDTTLEGNLSCAYLTKGLMTVNKNGLEIDVNFGDGSCDDIATLIYPNGATEEISLKD